MNQFEDNGELAVLEADPLHGQHVHRMDAPHVKELAVTPKRSIRELVSLWLSPRQWIRSIMTLDDTPHSIGLGTALGVFVAFTPTVGIQMFIVMAIALMTSRLFHFNRMAALIAVYISNPFTMVPIFWFNYRIGTIFFTETVSREEFARLFKRTNAADWRNAFWDILFTAGTPLLVGSLVVGLFMGLATYPIFVRLATGMQAHRHRKHAG